MNNSLKRVLIVVVQSRWYKMVNHFELWRTNLILATKLCHESTNDGKVSGTSVREKGSERKKNWNKRLSRQIKHWIFTGECLTAMDIQRQMQTMKLPVHSLLIIRHILRSEGLNGRIKAKKSPFDKEASKTAFKIRACSAISLNILLSCCRVVLSISVYYYNIAVTSMMMAYCSSYCLALAAPITISVPAASCSYCCCLRAGCRCLGRPIFFFFS